MIPYELPYGKIIILQDDMAEIIINDGIEMDADMVVEYHDFLLEHLTAPFSLLINKINSYTYTWEAQQMLGMLDEIDAMAVVTYNIVSDNATRFLARIPRKKEWNMKIFDDRDRALAWLEKEHKGVE